MGGDRSVDRGPRRRARKGCTAVVTCLALSVLPAAASAQLSDKLSALQGATARLYDGHAVTLWECVDAAVAGSAALGIAEESVRTANKEVLASRGAWLPNLNLSADWTRNKRTDYDQSIFGVQLEPLPIYTSTGAPLQIGGNDPYVYGSTVVGTADQTVLQTFRTVTLQSNLLVFDGFARIAGLKAADASLGSSEASLAYRKDVLAQNVSMAYYNLLRAKRQVIVANESEDLAKKEYERSQTYFDLGIATKSDVLQARVRYEQTRLDTVRARNGEEQAFADLCHLMNIPTSQHFDVQAEEIDPAKGDIPALDDLVAKAHEGRGDLKAARFDVLAGKQRTTQANANNYPNVAVFGQVTRSTSETPYRFGAQSNQSIAWGVSGSWNLFDRWQTKLVKQRSEAEYRRSEYMLQQTELDARNEIVKLRISLIEAKEQYDVASGTIEQTQEDLRLANERFRVGAGTSLDVINAQVNLTRARTDANNAVTLYLIARAQLARAIGTPLP
jgi:outer membrane protein